MYPAAFLRRSFDARPIHELADRAGHPGLSTEIRDQAGFWRGMRTLSGDVVHKIIDQTFASDRSAFQWSVIDGFLPDHRNVEVTARRLMQLSPEQQSAFFHDMPPQLMTQIYHEVLPELFRILQPPRSADETAQALSAFLAIVRAGSRNRHFYRMPVDFRLTLKNAAERVYGAAGAAAARERLLFTACVDISAPLLFLRFDKQVLSEIDVPKRVAALATLSGKQTNRPTAQENLSTRMLHPRHRLLLQSVLDGYDALSFDEKSQALQAIVEQRFSFPYLNIHPDDETQHRIQALLNTHLRSPEAIAAPSSIAELCRAVCEGPYLEVPNAVIDQADRLLELLPPSEQVAFLKTFILNPAKHYRRFGSFFKSFSDNYPDARLTKAENAFVSAFLLPRHIHDARRVAYKESIKRFKQAAKEAVADPETSSVEIGRIATVLAMSIAEAYSPGLCIGPIRENTKAFLARTTFPMTWIDDNWSHVNASQQRAIMTDLLPYFRDRYRLDDPAAPRWKERLLQTAAQPFIDDARDVRVDGLAFVRALRQAEKALGTNFSDFEKESYEIYLEAVLRAIRSTSAKNQFKVLSLWAPPAGNHARESIFLETIYKHLQEPHVDLEPEAVIPHLAKRFRYQQSDSATSEAFLQFAMQHLHGEDLLVSLARLGMQPGLPVKVVSALISRFVGESSALRAKTRTDTESKQSRFLLHSPLLAALGRLPVAIQDEAMRYISLQARSADLAAIVRGGVFPQTERYLILSLCVLKFETLPLHLQTRAKQMISSALDEIPPNLFVGLCEIAKTDISSRALSTVAAGIQEWHDPRIPYLINRCSDSMRYGNLPLELLRFRKTLPPRSVRQLWHWLTVSDWPHNESDLRRYLTLLADNFKDGSKPEIPQTISVTLMHASKIQPHLPELQHCIDAMLPHFDAISPADQQRLLEFATREYLTLSPGGRQVVDNALSSHHGYEVGNATRRNALTPSLVARAVQTTEQWEPLERLRQRFEKLCSERVNLPAANADGAFRSAAELALVKHEEVYMREFEAILTTSFADDSKSAIALSQLGRLLPEQNSQLASSMRLELLQRVGSITNARLRDLVQLEVLALGGDSQAEFEMGRQAQNDILSQYWYIRSATHGSTAAQTAIRDYWIAQNSLKHAAFAQQSLATPQPIELLRHAVQDSRTPEPQREQIFTELAQRFDDSRARLQLARRAASGVAGVIQPDVDAAMIQLQPLADAALTEPEQANEDAQVAREYLGRILHQLGASRNPYLSGDISDVRPVRARNAVEVHIEASNATPPADTLCEALERTAAAGDAFSHTLLAEFEDTPAGNPSKRLRLLGLAEQAGEPQATRLLGEEYRRDGSRNDALSERYLNLAALRETDHNDRIVSPADQKSRIPLPSRQSATSYFYDKLLETTQSYSDNPASQ